MELWLEIAEALSFIFIQEEGIVAWITIQVRF
jgi:hypothetical protein